MCGHWCGHGHSDVVLSWWPTLHSCTFSLTLRCPYCQCPRSGFYNTDRNSHNDSYSYSDNGHRSNEHSVICVMLIMLNRLLLSFTELNYNLQHSSSSSMVFPNSPTGIQQQMQFVAANNAMVNRRQAGLSVGSLPLGGLSPKAHHMPGGGHRPILVTHSHPMQMGHMPHGGVSQQVPLINSPSSGNILHVSSCAQVQSISS